MIGFTRDGDSNFASNWEQLASRASTLCGDAIETNLAAKSSEENGFAGGGEGDSSLMLRQGARRDEGWSNRATSV